MAKKQLDMKAWLAKLLHLTADSAECAGKGPPIPTGFGWSLVAPPTGVPLHGERWWVHYLGSAGPRRVALAPLFMDPRRQ